MLTHPSPQTTLERPRRVAALFNKTDAGLMGSWAWQGADVIFLAGGFTWFEWRLKVGVVH